MKCKTTICILITVFTASFSSLNAETRNRFGAGGGSISGFAFFEKLSPSPGITMDSPNEDIQGRSKDDTEFENGLTVYQAYYDRMVFENFALGVIYNYENINYIINYDNYDTSETDLTIHCLMPRIKIIYGPKRFKLYHSIEVGYAMFDETLTEKVNFVTESRSKTSYKTVTHFVLLGFELHLMEDFYLYMDIGAGNRGIVNMGAGFKF